MNRCGIPLVFAAVALTHLAVVFYRPVDIDEGYFLAAAMNIKEGQRPYLDFAFPQTPVFPYLLALLPAGSGGM